MELLKILKYLDKKFPEKAMATWDKSGIQLYDSHLNLDLNQDIKRVFITLDLTNQALDKAIEFNADLIITRHPFIFEDLKIEKNNLSKKAMIKRLLARNIPIYSIHTNYDSSKNNSLLALISAHLDIKKNSRFGEAKEGVLVKLKKPISPRQFTEQWKKILPKQKFSLSNNWSWNKAIKDFYLVSGAGGDTMVNSQLVSTVMVTGEMKWSHWLYALDNEVQVLSVGHEMENHFSKHLMDLLKNAYPELDFLTYYQPSAFSWLVEEH